MAASGWCSEESRKRLAFAQGSRAPDAAVKGGAGKDGVRRVLQVRRGGRVGLGRGARGVRQGGAGEGADAAVQQALRDPVFQDQDSVVRRMSPGTKPATSMSLTVLARIIASRNSARMVRSSNTGARLAAAPASSRV